MAETGKKIRIRVAEAVESGVEGILLFVVRYFRTGVSLLTTPKRMTRLLLADRHASRPTYVLPLTYLSIGLFLLSLLSQVAGLSIFDWIWFIDELASKVTDALGKEISLVKVAVQALPGVVVVALFGLLLRFGLRRAPISSRMVPFVLSYAFGVQTWALFITAFGFVVLGTLIGKWEPPGGKLGSGIFAATVYILLFGGILVAFIAPVVFAFSALRLKRFMRQARWTGRAITAFLAVGLIFGHVALLYAMGLPAKIVALASGPTSPELTIGYQKYSVSSGILQAKISVMLKNRDTKELAWETAKSQIFLFERAANQQGVECSTKGTVETLQVERVEDGSGKLARFVNIEPGQTQWFEITATKPISGWQKATLTSKPTWDTRVSIESVEGRKPSVCTEGSAS